MGDPPRRFCTRGLRRLSPGARIVYLARYRMNVSTAATRARFLAKVERSMARF
jgi:NAD(P)H dehydrogenase (quinone)